MAEVGKAELTVVPSFAGGQRALEKQLGSGASGPMAGAGKRAGGMFAGGLRSVVGPAVAAVGAGMAISFGKDAVGAASDLGESVNALDVVYGDLSSTINELGQSAGTDLGLSNVDFNSLSVQFSNFVKTVAGDGGDVAGTLDDLTTRAADFASVMNLEVAESAGLFQSGLAGETEPLRRFGIDLSAAAVESYAYANGIADVGEKLTEAEKVQARYGSLMEQTNNTAGDFANTSDSLANQQRILAAEWENMQAQLGTALLPVMQDVTGWLLEDGLPALQTFVNDLGDPTTLIGGLASDLETAFSGAFDFAANVNENGWDIAAPDFGSELSSWAASGESAAQQFIGAIDATLGSFVNGTVGEDWLSGAALVGADLSSWGDFGGNAGEKAVAALDGVFADYFEGGPGAIWENWKDGASGIWDQAVENFNDTGLGTPNGYVEPTQVNDRGLGNIKLPTLDDTVAAIKAGVPLDEGIDLTGDTIAAIKAPGGPLDPLENGKVIVNIGTVNATDTDDIVRKSRQQARTASLSGRRPVNNGLR